MRMVPISILLLCASLVMAEDQPRMLGTIYLRDSNIQLGKTATFVVELENKGTEPARVSFPRIQRMVSNVSGAIHVADKEYNLDRQPPIDPEEIIMTLEVLVPEESSQSLLPFPESKPIMQLAAGENRFLKVVIPAEAFALGQCSLRLIMKLKDKIICKSNVVDIGCLKKLVNNEKEPLK